MIDAISLAVFAVTFTVIGIFFLKQNGKEKNGKNYPPCLPSLPLVGSLPFLPGGMDILPDHFNKLSKQIGSIFSFYSKRELVVVLNGKKALYDALVKRSETFADRSDWWTEYHITNPGLRGLLFARYNENYKKDHKLALTILREFGFGISHESDVRIWHEIDEFFRIIRSHNCEPYDPRQEFVHATSRVIMNILFGGGLQPVDTYIKKLTHNSNLFIQSLDPTINLAPLTRFLPKYRKKIDSQIHASNEILSGLEEAIEHIKKSDSNENSFTKRYLEIEGPNYNHQQMLFLIRDLSLGSADTMAVTMSWALVEMVNHPDVQARCQKEIDDNVPTDRYPSYDDKRNLPYTEATMLECSRMHILAPFAITHKTNKDSEVCGFFIPKDTVIVPNLWSVHMDPDIWGDPKNFRPERFLDKDMNVIEKDNVIAFSLGRRSCIGETLARQEVFLFFSSILQHFDLRPPEGMDSIAPDSECGLNVAPINYKLRFIPRNRNK